MNIKDKFKKIRGKIEIIDKNGNLYMEVENLVLTACRAAILQVMFNDTKISIDNATYPLRPENDFRKLICGFALGNGGSDLNVSPSTVYVPSHNDSIQLTDEENTSFKKIPFLTITTNGDEINFENNGSYENLNEIINNASSADESTTSISNNNIIQTNTTNGVTTTVVKYFQRSSSGNKYYCKTFDVNNNQLKYSNSTGELEYIVKLNVENHDFVGETFSEIGLVLANCRISNNCISEIDDNSVKLATRATFTPISLSSELLSSFTIKYHIYF